MFFILKNLPIDVIEECKGDNRINVENNNVMPSISVIREELEFIGMLNEITQELSQKRVDNEYGKIFQNGIVIPFISYHRDYPCN